MRKFVFISFFFTLSSCISDFNYKSVEPYHVFHDNSSKVWVINHIYENGKDLTPLSLNYKKILVFHSSGYCYEYAIEGLGSTNGRKGTFDLNIDERKLEISYKYKKETIQFKIVNLSHNKINLKTKSKNKQEIEIELITFPEF